MSIGVVLNTYRRQDYFKEQVNAVLNQTVKFDRLIVNRNDVWDDDFFEDVDWVKSKSNAGVYRRFCLGLDLETDYLLFLDDDTIPAPEFLASLIAEHDKIPGLYSAAGFRLNHKNYADRQMYGWHRPGLSLDRSIVIDWPGHAWFFHRSILTQAYDIPKWNSKFCGEDMRLAFAAQKLSLKSYVAPYNKSGSNWGSTSGGAKGTDEAATWRLPNQIQNMHKAMDFYRGMGWKFLSEL